MKLDKRLSQRWKWRVDMLPSGVWRPIVSCSLVCLLDLFFDSEDGGNTFLRNIYKHPQTVWRDISTVSTLLLSMKCAVSTLSLDIVYYFFFWFSWASRKCLQTSGTWRTTENRRNDIFLTTYLVMWMLNLLTLTIYLLISVLILICIYSVHWATCWVTCLFSRPVSKMVIWLVRLANSFEIRSNAEWDLG
jgi:hypothetical protein